MAVKGGINTPFSDLLTKAQHLAEVAATDAVLWPTLVAHMLKSVGEKAWSVPQNSAELMPREGCAEFCTG